MMEDSKVDLIYQFLIALGAGIFGIAIAITAQHIKLVGVPKKLIIMAMIVQMLLSLGVFLGIMLVFRSALLPEMIPNDDFSALAAAYILSSIPHIVVATGITIYNKEINKWLEERYGDGSKLPELNEETESPAESVLTQVEPTPPAHEHEADDKCEKCGK